MQICNVPIITLLYFLCQFESFFADFNAQSADAHARRRRSNFPCGNSFVRCAMNPQLIGDFALDADITRGAGAPTKRSRVFAVRVEDAAEVIDKSGLETISSVKKSPASASRGINDVLAHTAADRALREIDELFNRTEPTLFNEFRTTNFLHSTIAWTELFPMDETAKALSRLALAALRMSEVVARSGAVFSAVRVERTRLARECAAVSASSRVDNCVIGRYRSYGGECNNVREPLWGAAYEPFARLQPPHYADGIGSIRRSRNSSSELPSTRFISRRLTVKQPAAAASNAAPRSASVTLMLVQWAQFVYEDVSQIASNRLIYGDKSLPIPCCAEKHAECMPIFTDPNDINFQARAYCIPYARSFVASRANCTLGAREQGNLATSFLDASHVYGRSRAEARQLRTFNDGLLKSSAPPPTRRELPPPANAASAACASAAPTIRPCFASASPWTNLLPTGGAVHTVILRQHNRIAKALKVINPHWEDERLYQEARHIVIAQLQHITYSEFLPLVVGRERLRSAGLALRHTSYDSDYNMRANPNTLNEYASAAGLFFLALWPDSIGQTDRTGRVTQRRHLSTLFNDPSSLYAHDRVDGALRFLIRERIAAPAGLSEELRERFLRGPDIYGLDAVALVLQMGRDHGLNSYTTWRRVCGLSVPDSFEALRDIVHESFNITVIAELYESVEDADLFVMGLAEKAENGVLLGPTFACIIARQFEKIRRGDRFWYENFFEPSAFSAAQLAEIRVTTLAGFLCANSDDIGVVQPNVFQAIDDYGNHPMPCNLSTVNPPMDLGHWRDEEPRRRLPITKEVVEKAIRLGAEQFRRLRAAEAARIQRQRAQATAPPPPASSAAASTGGSSPSFVAHANFLAPKKEALDVALTAGVLREATNILVKGKALDAGERLPAELDIPTLRRLLPEVDVTRVVGNITDYLYPEESSSLSRRDECLPRALPCDYTTKYRAYSGWCNNLRFPHYGNAFEPMRRLRDPVYDDGFDSPRTIGQNGRPLPSARRVSNAVHVDAPRFHVAFSHMLMQLGQMIDHDITHSPIARGPNNAILNCSRCDSAESLSIHCFPIRIEPDDPFFPAFHADGSPRCMPFARSLLGQLTLGYRNQLNQLSSFLDSSNIYGSTDCEANALRLFNRGRLNFTDLGYQREALPQGPQERDCRSRPRYPCFVAGDERNNEQPGLTALHTILLREHNRIATTLSQINTHWDDEKLFQETRRIMIAKLQHIVFGEFLPVVLGVETMERRALTPLRRGYFDGYDAACDAAVSQEVSAAALRFGHTLIRATFPRMNASFGSHAEAVRLEANFNNASLMYDQAGGHLESILMGLLGTPGMDYDRHIVDSVRNHLFQRPGGPLTGLDLPAVNIQRGRDHGIAPYNAYRELCGMRRAAAFDELRDVMDADAVDALRAVYAHVDDIDLFPGLMSERPLKGVLVGPMLACLLGEQFDRLKRCDRFYYENDNPRTRFTPSQLAEIRKTTLSKIICDNSEFAQRIQPKALLLPDELSNAPIKCSELMGTDLYEWIDRQFCVVDQRVIPLGRTRRVTPCIACTCTAEGPECRSVTVQRCEDLFEDHLLSEIKQDTVCVIQCAQTIREKSRLYRNGFTSREI